jgi:hypothetical protein
MICKLQYPTWVNFDSANPIKTSGGITLKNLYFNLKEAELS